MYLDVTVENPKFWWPNGIGQPNMYDFIVELYRGDNKLIDTKKIPFGIRTV